MGNCCGKSVTETKPGLKSVSNAKSNGISQLNADIGCKPAPERTLSTNVKHLGIIPDGNRRYSRQANVTKLTAYSRGIDVLFKLGQAAFERGVHTVTMWILSTDNFGRPKSELEIIFKLLGQQFSICRKLADKFNCRVRFIGQRNRVPKSILEFMNTIETESKSRTDHCLNIAIDYGGREDIVEAIRKIQHLDSVEKMSVETISGYVSMAGDEYPVPDLIVRTGAKDSRTFRNSGFLIWQSVYAEFYYENKYFPECDETDLENWLRIFGESEQRFGK